MMSPSASQSRRRDKPVLSCSFCRGRKMRCDRQSPCSACLRRGKPAECIYSSSERERRDAVDYSPHAGNQQARQRVARLENLVTQMRDEMKAMEQSSHQASGHTTAPVGSFHNRELNLAPHPEHLADSVGKLSLTDDRAVYTGSTHWGTILEEIQSLKDDLGDNSDADMIRESTPSDAGLPAPRPYLLCSPSSDSKEQILGMLPPRKIVDRHVSNFFNAFDFASWTLEPGILHRGRFLAEYSNFWDDFSAAPIMWIGLLFSVMSISAFLQQQDIGSLSPYAVGTQETLETYRTLTIHCLVAGNYLRPTRYTIETLTLHFAVDQNTNLDENIGNWILIGVVVRIALRMGLHRDPSHWPNIRPLEAEFRRRLWITLYHMDFFTSTQIGLPRIIKDSQCDAQPPANLFDYDLSSEHDEMPLERPLTDPTPLSHIIQRQSIIKVAAEIYDATEARLPSSAMIACLGAKLDKAVDSIPEQSRYRSLETSIADNPTTILHRIFLDILIQKAIYLLHRRSFMKGFVEEESAGSSKLCISAALAILGHQQRLNEESQPGGIMFGIRWKISSALNHEFLQATMMLCFALNKFNEGHVGLADSSALPRRDEIVDSLTVAKALWSKQANRSEEAHKAGAAITAVLKQDFDKSSSPNLTFYDQGFTPVLDQSARFVPSAALSEQMPGATAQNYCMGFDFGESMIIDPNFSAVDANTAAYTSLWDDFLDEHIGDNQAEIH